MFPSALRVIEEELFLFFINLKSIEFGDDSQLEEIKASAFNTCGLESFTAPASLCKIGKKAFAFCHALKHVDLSACTL